MDLDFKLGDRVQVSSRPGFDTHPLVLESMGKKGRVVQLNEDGPDGGLSCYVRLDGRKQAIWFKAARLRKLGPLDRLAEET
jgi:hypothetical protein